MIEGLLPSSSPVVTWAEADALASLFGSKGARLLTLPRAWIPPFVVLSVRLTERVLTDQLAEEEVQRVLDAVNALGSEDGIIVRSSVVGETIWERGTFYSQVLTETPIALETLRTAVTSVQRSAEGRQLALVVQRYENPDEWGEFGNLARVSKTRDQWEVSLRSVDPVIQQIRFNSQRDTAHDTAAPLLAKPRLSRERLFGSVAAWINNELVRSTTDRVNCEWVRKGNRYFLVQIDREDEDVFGVNPMQLHISPSITPAGSGRYLRLAGAADRKQWDKLLVLDELFSPADEIVPSLFLLNTCDAIEQGRATISAEFQALLGANIVVRVSVPADQPRITNLPKSDCLTPDQAASWCIETARSLALGYPGTQFAFVAHRFIASRSCAWVRADPESPTVEVHGNWGLPDALQFCPYDIWEVHFPGEQITELPAYKSDVLVNSSAGIWTYQRVRNDVARYQSLTSQQVLDVARRTLAIARKLGHPCHVMWFVGCRTTDDREANVPWYRTPAHEIDQPQKRSTATFRVALAEDLIKVADLKRRFPGLAVDLRPESEALLRDNAFLKAVAETVVPLNVPVQLQGSTLAHAFFQLRSHGVAVIGAGDKEYIRPRNQVSYAKLVRDKIPDKIAAQQEKQTVSVAPEEYRLGYLIGKLVEEALEVREAKDPGERLVELADVFEVLRALIALSGLTLTAVTAAAKKKRERSGGFDTGTLLWETSLPGPGVAGGTTDAASEAELLVDRTGPHSIRLPFTLLGFAGLGSSRTIELEEVGVTVRVTLQRDAVDIEVRSMPTQLSLDFSS